VTLVEWWQWAVIGVGEFLILIMLLRNLEGVMVEQGIWAPSGRPCDYCAKPSGHWFKRYCDDACEQLDRADRHNAIEHPADDDGWLID
jgi:hypothetical protein